MKRRFTELLLRVLCIATLLLADNYDSNDLGVRVGLFDKESILSYTVILIWVRGQRFTLHARALCVTHCLYLDSTLACPRGLLGSDRTQRVETLCQEVV